MSDRRYGRDDLRKAEPGDREISLTELVDGVVRKVVTAIVLAGGLVAIGAYAGGGGDVEAPRYQVSAGPDGRFYRVNTDSGTVIACQGEQCAIVLQRGQDLEDSLPPSVQIQIGPNTRPALPPGQNSTAPAQNPAPAAAPAPAPAPAPATR